MALYKKNLDFFVGLLEHPYFRFKGCPFLLGNMIVGTFYNDLEFLSAFTKECFKI